MGNSNKRSGNRSANSHEKDNVSIGQERIKGAITNNYTFNELMKSNPMYSSTEDLKKEYLKNEKHNNNNFSKSNYDIIVNLDLLSSLYEGIKIEKEKTFDDSLKEMTTNVLGIVGNSKSGKTFLLEKIMNEKIGNGDRTKGISVKYSKDKSKNVTIIDTEGLDLITNTKDCFSNEKINKLIRDKVLTREFLLNFVLENSNVLIFVTNSLSLDDIKINNLIKEKSGSQTVIVIHNFDTIEEIDYAKACIETFKKSFPKLKEQKYNIVNDKDSEESKNYNQLFFRDNYKRMRDNHEVNILHVLYCKEGSNAGKYYNPSTIKFIQKQISVITNLQKLDILQKLRSFIADNSPFYFSDILREEDVDVGDDLLSINKSENKEEDGKKKSFIPRNMIYIKDNQFWIYIELPYPPVGFKATPKLLDKDNTFIFQGEIKNPDKDKSYRHYMSTISMGKFELYVKIPAKVGVLSSTKVKDKAKGKGYIGISYCFSKPKNQSDDDDDD